MTTNIEKEIIRTMVRGIYDLQKIRIQMGNRITVSFKSKLGMSQDGMTEKQLAAQDKKLLDMLRLSYKRITDGIIIEAKECEDYIKGVMPSLKKFKGDEIISTYAELVLIDQYMNILKDEQNQFKILGDSLQGIPVYDKFLLNVFGLGPAMSGVIISEIDISRAEYSSSLWAYAGLDVVTIGTWKDAQQKDHVMPAEQVMAVYGNCGTKFEALADGHAISFSSVGRSRKEGCLVKKEYLNKEKELKVRDSITFNPFLKTKLIGVLGTAFIKASKTFVDGKIMSGAKRIELAETLGFDKKAAGKNEELKEATIEFLRSKGYVITFEISPYAQIYYDYKNRIRNMPVHADKTDGHTNNMAIRYMIKRFLVDLYANWRAIEGLPVAPEYSLAKLGLTHGKATEAKNDFYTSQNESA